MIVSTGHQGHGDDHMPPRPTLTIPAQPESAARLAFRLTGYTITGQPGAFGTVVGEHPGCVPAGPYTITDAAGAVVQTTDAPSWAAERMAVRHWRERCEQADDGLTFAAAAEQASLKTRIRALEAEIAACEARSVAIDFAHGCADASELDRALAWYGKAVDAHRAAVLHEQAQAGYAAEQLEKAA